MNERLGTIYKIENLKDGKIYIGQTIMHPMNRWRDHLNIAKRGETNYPLYNAINYFGIENFSFQILETNINSSELDYKECFYIKKYNSDFKTGHGYNLIEGGQERFNGIKLTEEEVLILIEDLKGDLSFAELSTKFGVCKGTISDINCGDTWHFEGISYPIRPSIYNKKNFSREDINDIYSLLKKFVSYGEIANKYGTSKQTIQKINIGKIYFRENIKYHISERSPNQGKKITIEEIKKIVENFNFY